MRLKGATESVAYDQLPLHLQHFKAISVGEFEKLRRARFDIALARVHVLENLLDGRTILVQSDFALKEYFSTEGSTRTNALVRDPRQTARRSVTSVPQAPPCARRSDDRRSVCSNR